MAVNPQQILERLDSAKSDRHVWENHWQDVADFVAPTRLFTRQNLPGEQLQELAFDETAPHSAQELAAILHGLLTNPSIVWFFLRMEDDFFNDMDEVRVWLENATRVMLNLYNDPDSGFGTHISEIYQDVVTFGTAVMTMLQRRNRPFFGSKALAGCWLVGDHEGRIVEVFREVKMRAREIVAEPGWDASDKVKRMAQDPAEAEEKITVVHDVFRRNDRDPQRRDGPNKPWASIYVEKETSHLLSESGFEDMPYLTPRWALAPEEVYGRSPAMTVLPGIRVVNKMTETQLTAGELAVAPPIMVPANGIEGDLRTAPHSINYMPSGTREFPQKLDLAGRIDIGADLIQLRQQKIERAFFTDVLRLPNNDRMTATEILQRVQQGLQLMSPVLSRLYSELISPIIRRTFNILLPTGVFGPPPEIMQGQPMTVQYVSPLALSQRASESQGFLQLMNLSAPLLQLDPTVAQNLDLDLTFRWLAELFNVTPRIMRRPDQLAQIRQSESQQRAAAAQADAGKTTAEAALAGTKALSELGIVNAA